MTDDGISAPTDRHCYAVVDGDEDAVDVSAAFAAAGMEASERVVLVGSTDLSTELLLSRLWQHGVDPVNAARNGQLIMVDQAKTHAASDMPAQQAVAELRRQATAAVRDGYTGIRFGGLFPGVTVSPHEHTLNGVISQHPATALCIYHAQAPAEVLSTVDHLHDSRVPSTTLFDDGNLRITASFPHRLRMVGRVEPGNRHRVMTVLGEAAEAGSRTINTASLQVFDQETLRTILALGVGLTQKPVTGRTNGVSAQAVPVPASPDATGRNGFALPGRIASTLVANLIWRTFGTARPGRAESVLDWAGLLGRLAAPIADVADRHHVALATVTSRVRHVQQRGSQTPLTPLQLRDASREPHPTEDQLSRNRIAQLLGLPPPRRPTA